MAYRTPEENEYEYRASLRAYERWRSRRVQTRVWFYRIAFAILIPALLWASTQGKR